MDSQQKLVYTQKIESDFSNPMTVFELQVILNTIIYLQEKGFGVDDFDKVLKDFKKKL